MSQNKKEWNRAEVEALIIAYEKHECLWNSQHPQYRDKRIRKRALELLSQMFNATEREIWRKLHNLRNQFRSEMKKTKYKRDPNNDELYVSKWPYFKLFQFLPFLESNRTSILYTKDQFSEENGENTTLMETIKTEDNNSKDTDDEDHQLWDTCSHQLTNQRANILDIDQYTIFGNFVANEIRSLTTETLRKKLKRKIQRCVLEVADEDDEM